MSFYNLMIITFIVVTSLVLIGSFGGTYSYYTSKWASTGGSSKREDIQSPPEAANSPEIKEYKNKSFMSYQNGYKYFQQMFSSGYSYLQSFFFSGTGKKKEGTTITIPDGITEPKERLKFLFASSKDVINDNNNNANILLKLLQELGVPYLEFEKNVRKSKVFRSTLARLLLDGDDPKSFLAKSFIIPPRDFSGVQQQNARDIQLQPIAETNNENENENEISSEEEGEISLEEKGDNKKSRRQRLIDARSTRYTVTNLAEIDAQASYGMYTRKELLRMIESENNEKEQLAMNLALKMLARKKRLYGFNSSVNTFEDLRIKYWLSKRPENEAMFVIICRYSNIDDSSIDELRKSLKKLHINYDAYLRRYIDSLELRRNIGNSLSNNRGKDLIDILAKEFKSESSKAISFSLFRSRSSSQNLPSLNLLPQKEKVQNLLP
jgi:hypothetical protein